jgi:hypothetical protein
LRSVDFPEPEGPTMETLGAGDLQIDGFKRSYLALAGVDLGNTCERNHPFIR